MSIRFSRGLLGGVMVVLIVVIARGVRGGVRGDNAPNGWL